MIGAFKSRQFVMFLITGGLAAAVNFGSRILYNQWMGFSAAIVLAYITGMITAFVLARIFVFQDSQLIPELPARENVALPLMLTGTPTRSALRAADEMLARLGLTDLMGRRPAQMSGGQAQRIAIARALVSSPRAIFADEPSGALDQATGHEMMQLLTAAVSMAGATLVVVTHDVNVARWCSRLIEIRDGLVHSDRLLNADTANRSAQATGMETIR